MRFWALIILLASSTALAEPYPPTYGLEMEFSAKTLANFIYFFDMEELQKHIPPTFQFQKEVLAGYVEHPKAWEALPPEVKSKLRGNAEERRRAWEALPVEERTPAIQMKFLSRRDQAACAIKLSPLEPGGLPAPLRLREDAPENVKSLFQKLKWHRDGNALELKYKVPTEDHAEYRADVRSLARLANVEKYLDRPLEKPGGLFTYHNNLGRKGAPLGPLTRGVNLLLYLRLLAAGEGKKYSGIGMNKFTTRTNIPGLVREGGDFTHLEIREHVEPFDRETEQTAELFRMEDASARRELAAKISEELKNPYAVEELRRRSKEGFFDAVLFTRTYGAPGTGPIPLSDPRVENFLEDLLAPLLGAEGKYAREERTFLFTSLFRDPDLAAREEGKELLRYLSDRFQRRITPQIFRNLETKLGWEATANLLKITYQAAAQDERRIAPNGELYFSWVLENLSHFPEAVLQRLVEKSALPPLTEAVRKKLRVATAPEVTLMLDHFLARGVPLQPYLDVLRDRLASRQEDWLKAKFRTWSGPPSRPCDVTKAVDP